MNVKDTFMIPNTCSFSFVMILNYIYPNMKKSKNWDKKI